METIESGAGRDRLGGRARGASLPSFRVGRADRSLRPGEDGSHAEGVWDSDLFAAPARPCHRTPITAARSSSKNAGERHPRPLAGRVFFGQMGLKRCEPSHGAPGGRRPSSQRRGIGDGRAADCRGRDSCAPSAACTAIPFACAPLGVSIPGGRRPWDLPVHSDRDPYRAGRGRRSGCGTPPWSPRSSDVFGRTRAEAKRPAPVAWAGLCAIRRGRCATGT